MSEEEVELVKSRLALLNEEHRDLDNAILALSDQPASDQLQLQRLKKRKLWLKDEIKRLEDIVYPDLIA